MRQQPATGGDDLRRGQLDRDLRHCLLSREFRIVRQGVRQFGEHFDHRVHMPGTEITTMSGLGNMGVFGFSSFTGHRGEPGQFLHPPQPQHRISGIVDGHLPRGLRERLHRVAPALAGRRELR